MISHFGAWGCRFFLVLRIVYIFNPAWVRAIELKIGQSIPVMAHTSTSMSGFSLSSMPLTPDFSLLPLSYLIVSFQHVRDVHTDVHVRLHT